MLGACFPWCRIWGMWTKWFPNLSTISPSLMLVVEKLRFETFEINFEVRIYLHWVWVRALTNYSLQKSYPSPQRQLAGRVISFSSSLNFKLFAESKRRLLKWLVRLESICFFTENPSKLEAFLSDCKDTSKVLLIFLKWVGMKLWGCYKYKLKIYAGNFHIKWRHEFC